MPSPRIQARYRNKGERFVGEQLERAGVPFDYEPGTLTYTVPDRKYLPDFRPKDKSGEHSNIILEYKGYFINGSADRQKLIWVRESNPHLDIRLIFSDASKPIYKGSKTTYGMWATANGFKWADKSLVPQEWLDEMKGQALGNLSGSKSRNAKRSR